jgi:hypothetical protein
LHPETRGRLGLDGIHHLTVSTPGGQITVALNTDQRVAPGVLVIPRHHSIEWQVVKDTRMVLKQTHLSGHSGSRSAP